ncbi:hypothetical protein MASR1M68_03540 [Elusimicrobiota bacterium]
MPPQTTRIGYLYQDLMALDELLNLYYSNDSEAFLEIDSNNKEVKSLDDVTISYSDGSKKLIQCKYSTKKPPEAISWDDLLESKPKGTSMLFKWQNRVNTLIQNGIRFEAYLYTNRICNNELKQSILNKHIVWAMIPDEIKTKLLSQDSVQDKWISFFDKFIFETELLTYEEMDQRLESRVTNFNSTNVTFPFIKDQIQKKAIANTNKKIFINDIINWFSTKFDKLNQNFYIPHNYQIPDKDFYNNFINEINNKKPLIILQGEPAIGKSTFLSKIINDLEKDSDKVFLRHHYFLSNTDLYPFDRLNYIRVKNDLERQLNISNGDIYGCLNELVKSNKHPIIIIDGLDHVLREESNKIEIERLMCMVLNLPEKVTVILGTQQLSNPPEILNSKMKDNVLELPGLNKEAILEYISKEEIYKKIKTTDINDFIKLLNEKTLGNPEILKLFILQLEQNSVSNQYITAYDMEKIPPYEKNIQDFYDKLIFSKDTNIVKDALCVIGSANFKIWNKDLISYCLDKLGYSQHDIVHAIKEISKYFIVSENIFIIRHESFYIFIQKIKKDKQKYLKLILYWLENIKDDNYWKIAYLQLVKIELDDLGLDITNTFLIESASRGYGFLPIINTLNILEKKLLFNNDYPKLIRCRHKKIRILNFNFNVYDQDKLELFSLSLMEDNTYFNLIVNSLVQHNHKNVTVARSLYIKNDELKYNKFYNELLEKEMKNMHTKYLLIDATKDSYDSISVEEISNLFELYIINDRLPYVDDILSNNLECFIVEKCLQYKKIDSIQKLFQEIKDIEEINKKSDVMKNLTLLLSIEHVENIDSWYINQNVKNFMFNNSAYFKFWLFSNNKDIGYFKNDEFNGDVFEALAQLCKKETRPMDLTSETEYNIEHVFTSSFIFCLLFEEKINIPKFNDKLVSISVIFNILMEFAKEIKDNIKKINLNEFIESFIEKITIINKLHIVENSKYKFSLKRNINNVINNIILVISILLFKNFNTLKIDVFTKLVKTLDISNLIIHNNFNNIFGFNKECLDYYTSVFSSEQNGIEEITTITEREGTKLELSVYARNYIQAKEILKRIYNSSLSYGSHKDIFIFSVIDAIKSCYEHKIGLGQDWYLRLAPFIENISKFTDGDETRHAKAEFVEILAMANISMAIRYYENINNKGEVYAGDNIFEILVEIANKKNIGIDLEKTINNKENHKSSASEKNINTVIKEKILNFKPNELLSLLKYMETNVDVWKDDYLIIWFDYWNNKEQKLLVDNIEKNLAEIKKLNSIYKSWDKIFEIVFKAKGKTKAYQYLIIAHIKNNGWSRYFSHYSIERLDIAANLYRDNWTDFIFQVSNSEDSLHTDQESNGIQVGSDLLVYYLCKIGENSLAEEITETMIQLLEEDVKHLKLKPPVWIQDYE